MSITIKIKTSSEHPAKGNMVIHTHAGGDVANHIVSDETVAIEVGPNAEKSFDIAGGCTVNISLAERPAGK